MIILDPEQIKIALIVAKMKLKELMQNGKYNTENTDGARGSEKATAANSPNMERS